MTFICIVVLEVNCLSLCISRSHEFERSATKILHTESSAVIKDTVAGDRQQISSSVSSAALGNFFNLSDLSFFRCKMK